MWRLLKFTFAVALLGALSAVSAAYWWAHAPLTLPAGWPYDAISQIVAVRAASVAVAVESTPVGPAPAEVAVPTTVDTVTPTP